MVEQAERGLSAAVNLLVIVAVVLWLLGGGAELLRGRFAAQGITHFTSLSVTQTVSAEQLTSTDDATITDSLAAANVALTGLFRESAGSPITVTQDGVITPVASFQHLTAAGAVSTSSIAVLTSGTWVTLHNYGSNTITISDTGTLKLSGNIALGASDTLTLWCDGTNWIQVATSNN